MIAQIIIFLDHRWYDFLITTRLLKVTEELMYYYMVEQSLTHWDWVMFLYVS